jgi:putative transposase
MDRASKKSKKEGAHLVLIDETGLFLNPIVRRSWSKKGKTPIVIGDGSRKKVSVLGALTVSPQNRKLNFYFSKLVDGYFSGFEVANFLRTFLKRMPSKVWVIWDGGPNHSGSEIRELLEKQKRIIIERLPAYAPELNPVEIVWSWLKYGKLANFVPKNLEELQTAIDDCLVCLREDPNLLRSLWDGSELPFPVA